MPNIILCNVLSYTTNGLCNTAKTNYSAAMNGDSVVEVFANCMHHSWVLLTFSRDKGYILSFMAAQHSDDAVN